MCTNTGNTAFSRIHFDQALPVCLEQRSYIQKQEIRSLFKGNLRQGSWLFMTQRIPADRFHSRSLHEHLWIEFLRRDERFLEFNPWYQRRVPTHSLSLSLCVIIQTWLSNQNAKQCVRIGCVYHSTVIKNKNYHWTKEREEEHFLIDQCRRYHRWIDGLIDRYRKVFMMRRAWLLLISFNADSSCSTMWTSVNESTWRTWTCWRPLLPLINVNFRMKKASNCFRLRRLRVAI